MHIESVDLEPNLYSVADVVPGDLVNQILTTAWLDLPWQPPMGQPTITRRQIDIGQLPWALQWDLACHALTAKIGAAVDHDMGDYVSTAWWLDQPGHCESVHSLSHDLHCLHLYWIGARQDLGTRFYWHQDGASQRWQFACAVNSGWLTVNRPNHDGKQNYLWNGMLEPVPRNTFRLSSQVCFGTA